MLPAHLQELLTAAVDGELTHAERRLVDKLLHDSTEARDFHANVLANAQRLRNALRLTPADDLATDIMAIIDERGIRPTPLPMRRRNTVWNSNQFLPWFTVATAAVVVIAVSIGSYLMFTGSQSRPLEPVSGVVATPPAHSPKNDPVRKQFEPREEPLLVEIGPDPREVEPRAIVKNEPKPNLEMLPDPRVWEPDLHAVPVFPQSPSIKVVELNLSLLLPLKDLDQAYPKKQLRDRLANEEIVRINLFCNDSTRAAEQVQAALKARGQQITIDAIALDRLKKRQKTDYVFFTETMTVEEIALLMEALGAADRRAESRKAGEGSFSKFLLAPFTNGDAVELAKLLGVRRDALKLPKIKTGYDPRLSLEEDTANKVASSLPKGSTRNDKRTLVLPNGPVYARPETSKEIRAYLDKRGERKPETVPFMLVLITPE